MTTDVILLFLGASLVLYCLFAGADFGAGIVEWICRRVYGRDISSLTKIAMGPVWEANHMWVIIAVVILFNGFPQIYSQASIYFHIPLTLMLIGIIFRGCAYTFRHYDAIKDGAAELYSRAFQLASILTPITMGLMAGALILGNFPAQGGDYLTVYINPWANGFSLGVGLFVVSLFTFLAAIYFVGETKDQGEAQVFRQIAFWANIGCVAVGGMVLVLGNLAKTEFLAGFASHPVSIGALGLATFLLWPLWVLLKKSSGTNRIRMIAGLQVTAILVGWFGIQFPVVFSFADGQEPITFYSAAAGESTLRYLAGALLGGSLGIFPCLYYLFHVFKVRR